MLDKEDYTLVPRNMWRISDLSTSMDFIILCRLFYCEQNGLTATRTELFKLTDSPSKATINRSLARLVNRGYATKTINKDASGRYLESTYVVNTQHVLEVCNRPFSEVK